MSTTLNIDTRKTYTVGDMAIIRAKQRGVDVSRAAKEIRGILRANFATVVKLDPTVKKVKTNANDGNRWPSMNGKVATFALDRTKRDGLKSEAQSKQSKA